MFDELLRTLRNLDGQKVSLQVQCDEEGYLDRECPNTSCLFGFKIHGEDWRNIVRDEEVFCPACGHAAPARSWTTTAHAEGVKQAASSYFKGQINQAMRRDAEQWNRRQRSNSLVSVRMQVKGQSEPVLLPLAATKPMQLKIACKNCQCRYGVIGSAYFCPACGHNAAEQVFSQSLDKIRTSLDLAPLLRSTISDQDAAENTVRQLIEDGLQRAVTAFQRFAEALFAEHPSPPKARRNAFQNLEEGSRLWAQAFGKRYDEHLSTAELATLGRYFQQRHLMAHRDGLVDAEYVSKSADTSYREGQRLVIQDAGVRECVDLVEKLGSALRADCQAFVPPS